MHYFWVVFCLFISHQVNAITLTVIDQHNQPVSNAVIMLSGSYVDTPDTEAMMDQIQSEFVPRVLVVQKNQSVSFPNSDDYRHHVYSFSIPKAFEIKLYKGGDIPPINFDSPGVVILGCNIHDGMIGYIIVADNEYAAITDEHGQVTLPTQVKGHISLWSERFLEGVNDTKSFEINGEPKQTLQIELLPELDSHHHEARYSEP